MLLTIAIPTYNKACFLEHLLGNILPQAEKLTKDVEVCISSNGSNDNTREVVMSFEKKYPGLIRYNENEKNLGFDANLLKLIEMSSGNFLWPIGDDDLIVEDGLDEVVQFLKKTSEEKTGLILVRTELYFIDKKTGGKIVCSASLDKSRPETFRIDKKDIIASSFPDAGFISALIFNNKLLKKIAEEEKSTLNKAIGASHMHVFLYSLMFLKYSYLEAVVLNKPMVLQEMPCYKFFIEDKFMLHYQAQKKINNLLLVSKYMDDIYAAPIVERNNKLRRGFVEDLIIMRAFNTFNYFSYFGCLKLFVGQSAFPDGLTFSFLFSALFLIPPSFLRFMYKTLLMAKMGRGWKEKWLLVNNTRLILAEGTRRRNDFQDNFK